MGDDGDVYVATCVIKCVVRGAVAEVPQALIWVVDVGFIASNVVVVVLCFFTVEPALSIAFLNFF